MGDNQFSPSWHSQKYIHRHPEKMAEAEIMPTPILTPMRLFSIEWFSGKDKQLHQYVARRFPRQLALVDKFAAWLFEGFSHAAFATIFAAVFIVLGATGVVNITVAVALIVAWLTAFLWIARCKWISRLTIPTKVIVITLVGLLLAVGSTGFGEWAIRYRASHMSPEDRLAEILAERKSERSNRFPLGYEVLSVGGPRATVTSVEDFTPGAVAFNWIGNGNVQFNGGHVAMDLPNIIMAGNLIISNRVSLLQKNGVGLILDIDPTKPGPIAVGNLFGSDVPRKELSLSPNPSMSIVVEVISSDWPMLIIVGLVPR
jgi:hypothetical protein